MRPNGDPASSNTVCPGCMYLVRISSHATHAPTIPTHPHSVVWWDPRDLKLDAEPPLGIRRSELIVKDVAPQIVAAGLSSYTAWREGADRAVADGSRPSISAQTVTQWAKSGATVDGGTNLAPVEVIEIPREPDRPTGRRFGALVHAVLATVPLDGDADVIQRLTSVQARTLGATDEEAESAAKVVQTVLAQPILARAHEASKANRCRRDTPVVWRDGDNLIEGVVDLAFEADGKWTVVDFKTDEELTRFSNYAMQVGLYGKAMQAATGQATSVVLMRI